MNAQKGISTNALFVSQLRHSIIAKAPEMFSILLGLCSNHDKQELSLDPDSDLSKELYEEANALLECMIDYSPTTEIILYS